MVGILDHKLDFYLEPALKKEKKKEKKKKKKCFCFAYT